MSTRRTRASARSEPAARPQQPTDSPAASSPNETLAQILELSLEHTKPWDKQRARINFGKVCYTWYGVALPLRDCVVPDSKRAQSLAAVLKQGRLGERPVRSLDIEVEATGSGRGSKIAKLLRVCATNLQRLRLYFGDETFLSSPGALSTEGPLGKPVTEALKTLRALTQIELDGVSKLSWSTLDSFFVSWPRLESLLIPGVFIKWPSDSPAFRRAPHLRYLRLLTLGTSLYLLSALTTSSNVTLTSLDLGPVDALQLEAVIARLEPILAQLTSFKMIDGVGYELTGTPPTRQDTSAPVEVTLKQLKAVRHLTLGIHAIEYSKLFELLVGLKELRNFSLDADVCSDCDALRDLAADDVAHYIHSAPASLITISFPAELAERSYWSLPEEVEVMWSAHCKRVKTWWVTKVDRSADVEV